MITNIGCVPLYVADQDRALAFYTGALGLEVRTDAEMAPGKRWLEVAPKGARTGFVLSSAADFEREPGSSTPPTLETDDVTALHERLVAAGHEVGEPTRESWGTYLSVTDPDGHTLVVSERTR